MRRFSSRLKRPSHHHRPRIASAVPPPRSRIDSALRLRPVDRSWDAARAGLERREQHRPLSDTVHADPREGPGEEVDAVARGVDVVVVAVLERRPHREATRAAQRRPRRKRWRAESCGNDHRVVREAGPVAQHDGVLLDAHGVGLRQDPNAPGIEQPDEAPCRTTGQEGSDVGSALQQVDLIGVAAGRQVRSELDPARARPDNGDVVTSPRRRRLQAFAQPSEVTERLHPDDGSDAGRYRRHGGDAADVEGHHVPLEEGSVVGGRRPRPRIDGGDHSRPVVDPIAARERRDVDPALRGVAVTGGDARRRPAVVEPHRCHQRRAVAGSLEAGCVA